ncbi:UDP-4-amino-4-deoxy-L-arabinose--oxoglutarate aminotransferase [Streptococcus intermedius]|uniref:UDP-4-amino-4-deoxy-L-arabinose--oxoglutarate aminotransferase n=1 Tax=Streptococcus intermedius TaxID=1338 RepID=A0AAE8G2X7_STRIT|nr:DegT/DnrJ/EryC1/StrS family aminotransferase [Streptococcus intermedius]RSJ24157.1 UDP-4-amino-4-deoxy-L-arabinose--oxoglutarate aminotransferase [Streptococcus intermedius]
MAKFRKINEILNIKGLRFNTEGALPANSPYEDTGICPEAAEEVSEVIRSGKVSYWGGGPKAKKLEKEFSDLIGRRHSFFHSSGSSALITAVRAFDLAPGTDVAITSSGFISSLNAVYHANLRPRFIPTDPETLLGKVSDNSHFDSSPTLALVTHFFGNVVDVDDLVQKLSPKYLIEDASQALGSKYKNKYVGGVGDISTFAGSNRKLFGAGQGGINVYDDDDLGKRMRIISHHGKHNNVDSITPGYNFRGGEMEAVLGLYSLKVLNEKAKKRNDSAEAFSKIVLDAGIQLAQKDKELDCEIVWFDNAIILPEDWKKNERDLLVEILNYQGVPAWIYPALIETPWLKKWMVEQGWWTKYEEELLEYEKSIWDRVFVVGTQMSSRDAHRCAQIISDILVK